MVEQFRPINVYLRYMEGIGLGVYAVRDFKKGDFLFSATGRCNRGVRVFLADRLGLPTWTFIRRRTAI